MVDDKKLRELIEQGIVTTEDGIRVIDASRLDGPVRQRHRTKDARADIGRRRQNEAKILGVPEPIPEEIVEEVFEKKTLLPTDMKKLDTLNREFEKEFEMAEEDIPKGVGLDVGTSF